MARATGEALKSSVIYSVFPRNHGSVGGFAAIEADLSRIKSLGADILWLMPIHPVGVKGRKGSVGSPYAIRDYYSVDPALGTEAELSRLAESCHKLGMSIIIDVVYNHTSPDSVLAVEHPEYFLRNKKGEPIPKHAEWWDIVDLEYFDQAGQPKRGLWEHLIGALEKWTKLGIDGFRCDVASLVPIDFWREARGRLEGKGAHIWLAETTHRSFIRDMRSRGYSAHCDAEVLDVFDLSYDYDGWEHLDSYWAGKKSLDFYLEHVEIQETMLPQHGAKLRFVENHDQPRGMTKFGDVDRLKNWTCFMAFLPGAFLAYAGQEFLAPRQPSLFDPDPISLQTTDGNSYSAWMEGLLKLVKLVKAQARFAGIRRLAAGVCLIDWADSTGRASFHVLCNLESRFGSLKIDDPLSGRDLLNNGQVQFDNSLEIPRLPRVIEAAGS